MGSPDRLKELRRKLSTASIGSKTVDTYLGQMSHLKEELVSDLGSLVKQDEFIRAVLQGLGPDYLCVEDEVFFHDTAPPFEKLCKYVLRRQSILQGAADERPIYICNDCRAEWHMDISFDVIACRACHCENLLKK